jgi:hypothetical protein
MKQATTTERAAADPKTPIAVAETKTIQATDAESYSTMNSLLLRLEMGTYDLQSQLDILANTNDSSILCGINDAFVAPSMPTADGTQQ